MKNIKKLNVNLFLIMIFMLSACQQQWEIEITSNGQVKGLINENSVAFYLEKSAEEVVALPLGQMLYDLGFTLVDQIILTSNRDQSQSFNWGEIAQTSTISATGEIKIYDEVFSPTSIDVITPDRDSEIELSIMDIAPTMADALGLPGFPNSQGRSRHFNPAQKGVLILLDGLQYEKLISMSEAGELPFFQGLMPIAQGLTVYPPITTSATAAVLTGTPPKINGVFGYGYRSTDLTTLIDLAADNGITVKAVEGSSLSFNLRNAETILSGDRDGDGFSDDNVFSNSMEIIQRDMPGLLFIHFHEIDDMGHRYGPESEEYEAAIIRVDEYLSELFEVLPTGTFISIFADHGMHATDDGGNHGTLTAEDLIIPIIFLEK